uniref:PGG domain-containing protein n=1 Tax=Oryza punctata TaxID=4537 RepID=A0A0E0LAL0_ORYPU
MANGTSQDNNIEGNFKLLWSLRKYLILLGTIAVGVTYNAGLTPPGGFWTLNKDNHQAGNPVLPVGYFQRYEVFFYCNATAFAASLVLIILLLSKSATRHVLWLRSMQFTMILDLFSLMGAYAVGSCRALKSSIYVWILVFSVFLYVGVHVLVFMRVIPDKLKEMVQKTLWCVHDRQSDRLQDKDVEDARKFILILVTFTATVTYQAGLSPPGGFWAENEYDPLSKLPPAFPPYKHRPATSVLRSNYLDRYKVFVSCNSTSFVASLVTVILLLSTELSKHGIRSKAVIICVAADLLCLIGAYAAGCCRDVATSFYVMFITMIVLICFILLVGIFAHKPVAIWLQNLKRKSLRCVSAAGRVLSSSSRSNGFSNGDHNHDTEIVGTNDDSEPVANGHIHSNQVAPIQNVNGNQIEEHLNKTRKNLLLLAILAVSLTYQSGLNPPGGFWSGNEFHHADGDHILEEYHHSAGDRILEDTYHSRFIAFFYLNAVAFVASVLMIILLLNKVMIMEVTKQCALQIVMIVNLLSLTGAFVMGSCREANKSIYISVLLCLVLAYVLVHVLIAIHVLCRIVSRASSVSPQNRTEDTKELGRRRNLLLTLSVLAATVTYQAGMNPPGGVWSDDKDVSGKPGNPILQDTHPKRYDVFYYSNSLSFVSSVVTTILLVNKESCEHGIKSYALRVCLVVGLVGLLIAYAAGSCRKAIQSIYLIIIAVAVLISVVIQGFLLSSTNNTLWTFLSTRGVNQDSSSGSQENTDPQEKKERKRKKYLMLLAVLAASIAYQAGLNPPGGFWPDDSGHKAGNPILHDVNHRRYRTFFCFNAFSFMSSIVVIMLLLSRTIREKDVHLEVLYLIMILDLLALMTAFAAGSCRKFRTSVYVYGLVICVVIYLLLVTVLSSGIAKYLRSRKVQIPSQNHPENASRADTPDA